MIGSVRVKTGCASTAAKLFVAPSLFASALLLFAATASAQTPIGTHLGRKVALQKFLDAADKLSPEVRKHLSPAMRNYLRFANATVNDTAPPTTAAAEESFARNIGSLANLAPALIHVSNVAMNPPKQGYTQNTSSSAWCGSAVVVGYEDSGALFRTDPRLVSGVPNSINGVSYSTNAGKTFTDVGFLNPGTFSDNALIGDPSVTCTSSAHFQYASILNTMTPDGLSPIIGPSVSFSTNGGKTWTAPLQVVSLDGNTEIADQPWLAVDPANAQRLYLSFTEMDALSCVSIKLVTSGNGGKSWSAPALIDQQCPPTQPPFNPQNDVAGSRVIVAPDDKVYVAYEFFPGLPPGATQINSVNFAISTNHGASFSKPRKIANLVPSGTGVELNGHLTIDEYPQIAVDRSASRTRGTLYITYPDGRDHVVPDSSAASGTYAYPDIFVAKSTNSGQSFTVLGAISRTPKDFTGIGRDQFLPAVAVDNDGEVAVCYYDRRNDRSNLRVDRFCSVSANQGKTWTDQEQSSLHWLPSRNADPLNSGATFGISEYDVITTDFLQHTEGFFNSFIIEINAKQSVVATKF